MPANTDLTTLLQSMEPRWRPGRFVFVCVPLDYDVRLLEPQASVQEDEGLTLVVEQARADAVALPYSFVAAWIALTVTSALEAVGLTAAFSAALGTAGISCNVLAGFHHDHLLVPYDDAERALTVLRALAAQS